VQGYDEHGPMQGSRQAGGPPRCLMESTRRRVVCRHTLSTTFRAVIAASRPHPGFSLRVCPRLSVSLPLTALACGRRNPLKTRVEINCSNGNGTPWRILDDCNSLAISALCTTTAQMFEELSTMLPLCG
jgi:hypothetical protein